MGIDPVSASVISALGSSLISGHASKWFGGGSSKSSSTTDTGTTAASTTAADEAGLTEEEIARRRRAAMMSSTASPGQLTLAGGDTSNATISRKTLLGA